MRCKYCGSEIITAKDRVTDRLVDVIRLKNGKYIRHLKFCSQIRAKKMEQKPLIKVEYKD